MTIVTEIKAENCFVPVPLFLGLVLDQNANSCCYSYPFLQAPGVYFVGERDKIAQGINVFLAQFEKGRASAVTFVDLVDMQLLNFSGC